MKRLMFFLVFVVIIIGIYAFYIHSARDYSIKYEVDDFEVEESYDKDNKKYTFTIVRDDYEFHFAYETDYSNERKLIDKIKVKESDDYLCVKPSIERIKTDYICYDGEYKVISLLSDEAKDEEKKINTYKNVNIYADDYDYYIWNGHGITNILTEKEYNFLGEQYYDNNLAYKINNYIIFANYNQKRTFNSFYIFDYKEEEMKEWNFDIDIDYDAFFMGDVEGYIYLFDRKNSLQYKIDVIEKNISVSSDNEGALYFDGEWKTKSLKDLKYNDYYMEVDNLYSFILENDKLYLNIDNYKENILLTNKKIIDIVDKTKDEVFYLVEDDIYVYKMGGKETKLLDYFEWNFSYKNKVYIFD